MKEKKFYEGEKVMKEKNICEGETISLFIYKFFFTH
jgi:hypothetical protein